MKLQANGMLPNSDLYRVLIRFLGLPTVHLDDLEFDCAVELFPTREKSYAPDVVCEIAAAAVPGMPPPTWPLTSAAFAGIPFQNWLCGQMLLGPWCRDVDAEARDLAARLSRSPPLDYECPARESPYGQQYTDPHPGALEYRLHEILLELFLIHDPEPDWIFDKNVSPPTDGDGWPRGLIAFMFGPRKRVTLHGSPSILHQANRHLKDSFGLAGTARAAARYLSGTVPAASGRPLPPNPLSRCVQLVWDYMTGDARISGRVAATTNRNALYLKWGSHEPGDYFASELPAVPDDIHESPAESSSRAATLGAAAEIIQEIFKNHVESWNGKAPSASELRLLFDNVCTKYPELRVIECVMENQNRRLNWMVEILCEVFLRQAGVRPAGDDESSAQERIDVVSLEWDGQPRTKNSDDAERRRRSNRKVFEERRLREVCAAVLSGFGLGRLRKELQELFDDYLTWQKYETKRVSGNAGDSRFAGGTASRLTQHEAEADDLRKRASRQLAQRDVCIEELLRKNDESSLLNADLTDALVMPVVALIHGFVLADTMLRGPREAEDRSSWGLRRLIPFWFGTGRLTALRNALCPEEARNEHE